MELKEKAQIIQKLKELEKSQKNMSPAAKAIYELAENLWQYKEANELDDITVEHTNNLVTKLVDSLTKNSKDKKAYPDLYIKMDCQKALQEEYKYIASEPNLWNSIKDYFNYACKAIGLPALATLDASKMGNSLKTNLGKVKNEGIQIKDEKEVDLDLNTNNQFKK